MEAFKTLHSKVIPLPMNDVDTDLIIPAQYLTSVSRAGYGENLFRRLRDADPQFVLNQPHYQGSSILLAGKNFGCGSSREHAVWALQGWGIKAVLASSFADIFAGNSAKSGLLLIALSEEVINQLTQQALSDTSFAISIDLANQQIKTDKGNSYEFSYDSFRKHCLLQGLDDIDYILSFHKQITDYRTRNESQRFFSTQK